MSDARLERVREFERLTARLSCHRHAGPFRFLERRATRVRFSLFLCRLYRSLWRVVRRERWPTREEREGAREPIAEAGGVRSWLRADQPEPDGP